MTTETSLLSTDETFAAYLASEVDREGRRRDSIDSRSVASVSGSAGVLAFGAGAFTLVHRAGAASGVHHTAFWVFLGSFLVAIVAATAASVPRWQQVDDLKRLTAALRDNGRYDRDVVLRHCVRARAKALKSLRQGNDRKVRYLLAAQVLQGCGVAALVLAIWPLARS